LVAAQTPRIVKAPEPICAIYQVMAGGLAEGDYAVILLLGEMERCIN
jgi:hypothetical protein